jgi:hypothetical protein
VTKWRLPIHVPDVTKPAGAAVDAHGEVTCVACGKHLPVGDADIVGLGYRCAACSEKATGDDDVAANLPRTERSLLKKLPSRTSFVITGCVLLAVAMLMWVFHWDLTWNRSMDRQSLFVWIGVAAVGCFGLATAPR